MYRGQSVVILKNDLYDTIVYRVKTKS